MPMKYKEVISIGQNSLLVNEMPHIFLRFQERKAVEKAKQESRIINSINFLDN